MRSRWGPGRRGSDGFTLVELMIVVVIIGLLAAVAITSLSRHVARARTAEAAEHLNKLWTGAISYYSDDHTAADGTTLPRQFPGPTAPSESTQACGCMTGGRCPGGAAAWNHPIWTALLFSIPDPHSYMPGFRATGTGVAAQFTATAVGDLDCDSVLSTFERQARIDAVSGEVTGMNHPAAINEFE